MKIMIKTKMPDRKEGKEDRRMTVVPITDPRQVM